MFLYIELWKPKDAWLRLTADERRAKLDHLRREAAANPIPGVLPFSFRQVGDAFLFDGVAPQPTVIDNAVARPTGFRYAAAWMILTRELIDTFERRIAKLGWWYDYFEQRNAWGEINPQATLAALVGSRPGSAPAAAAASTIGRARLVRRLRQDVDELKRDVSTVVDYVKTTQSRGE
jgi:hypothetical protein